MSESLSPAPTSKTGAQRTKFLGAVHEVLHWAEVLIAFFAIAVVVMGGIQLVRMCTNMTWPDHMEGFFAQFEGLFSALLLLVVGVELAIMLVLRRPESLLGIMFFVIARKVLIKTDHVYELLLAVLAIGVLFAVKRYLVDDRRKGRSEA